MRFPRLLTLSALLTVGAALTFAGPGIASAHGVKAGSHRPQGKARLFGNVEVSKKARRQHRKPASKAQTSVSPDLLFRGTKIKDFAMNQSAPGAVTEVPDPAGSGQSVLEMTVKNSDVAPVTPTSDPRAQLLSPSIITPGEEFWWGGKFFLPTDFPSSVPGWLTVMEGPYGAPFDGTPPWHIEINGSSIRWSRDDTYNWDVPWEIPLVRGSWVSVVVHERFGSDGWVEMWVNGQPITFFAPGSSYNPAKEPETQHLAMQTMDHTNDGGPNFTVVQSYRRAGMFESVSLFQGPMSIGRTRAAIES
jgi:hypothetical protein